MEWTALIPLIAEVAVIGLKTWSNNKRDAFQQKHYDIIKRLERAQNATPDKWTDSEIDLAKEDLERFLKAFLSEAKK